MLLSRSILWILATLALVDVRAQDNTCREGESGAGCSNFTNSSSLVQTRQFVKFSLAQDIEKVTAEATDDAVDEVSGEMISVEKNDEANEVNNEAGMVGMDMMADGSSSSSFSFSGLEPSEGSVNGGQYVKISGRNLFDQHDKMAGGDTGDVSSLQPILRIFFGTIECFLESFRRVSS
jgi:hypothetical protein